MLNNFRSSIALQSNNKVNRPAITFTKIKIKKRTNRIKMNQM